MVGIIIDNGDITNLANDLETTADTKFGQYLADNREINAQLAGYGNGSQRIADIVFAGNTQPGQADDIDPFLGQKIGAA
jgi:hypothetical protein